MELKVIELSDIEKMQGEHCLIIISNGQMKCVELPLFGTTVIESHCNKVKQVKEEVKQLF
ncbi:XtrA/YqaO family protein [Enterococcus faecium]|uniref:XtrA/YqaO family protein n=1 Tax=Enterococcus faecium TaxID=1352 RepID=UPI0020184F14|nr:XtrA/YqaO family protein [Enterococcus faecium]UQQ78725.1 XtrA/YqaO family protein [Enterococcus faecium]